jgi:hypothetical protein
MAEEKPGSSRTTVRDLISTPRAQVSPASTSVVRATTSQCDDCRANAAFHAWHSLELTPPLTGLSALPTMEFRRPGSVR